MSRKKDLVNCFLSLLVVILGGVALCGWVFDIDALKYIHRDWATIKPMSAILLIISGLIPFFISSISSIAHNFRKMVVSFLVFLSFFIVFLLSFNNIQSIFLPEAYPLAQNELLTVYPLFPSLGSLFCFLLVGIRGFMYIFSTNKIKIVKALGFLMSSVSISSMIGLLTDHPALSFYYPGKSTAMAFFSTLGALLIGIVFLNSQDNKEDDKKLL